MQKKIGIIALILVLVSFASAEDMGVDIKPYSPAPLIEIIVEPVTEFYRYVYVFDSGDNYKAFVNMRCDKDKCSEKSSASFVIPLDWEGGEYYVKVYDYSKNEWIQQKFNIPAKDSRAEKQYLGEYLETQELIGIEPDQIVFPGGIGIPWATVFLVIGIVFAILLIVSLMIRSSKKGIEKGIKLAEYVKKERGKGTSDDEISSYLVSLGWSKDIVQNVFKEIR